MSSQPSEDELKTALTSLRADNPSLGVPKLHAALLAAHVGWAVSEKRTRKILQAAGLTNAPPPPKNGQGDAGTIYPSSRVIKDLDVSKWTTKVAVKDFGRRKGKGLVATEEIKEGAIVWKEDPFILAPEWGIYNLQATSRACAYCSTHLSGSSLVVPCPASPTGAECTARFCTRLCLARSQITHPLLCPAQNPACSPFIDFARRSEWLALHALAQLTARVLLVREGLGPGGKSTSLEESEREWKIVKAFAELGMEERAKVGWVGREPDRETWKKAHKLYIQAFRTPSDPVHAKKLARILKKPLEDDSEIAKDLFEYDAFLRGLGKMSLNLESHGGLYILHSHLNHSCEPNISIRHADQRTALARISVIPRRSIAPGEELTISYVDPSLDVNRRREGLREWGFVCNCTRCLKDEKLAAEVKEEVVPENENGEAQGEKVDVEGGQVAGKALDLVDLEKELKAGLGVM